MAGDASDAVDVFNRATGAWATARLSVARWGFGAASVGNVAVFAGGTLGSTLGSTLPRSCESMERAMRVFMLSVIV